MHTYLYKASDYATRKYVLNNMVTVNKSDGKARRRRHLGLVSQERLNREFGRSKKVARREEKKIGVGI